MATHRINDDFTKYPYDPEKATEVIEVDLDNDVLLTLATMAHERDITLNHLMCAILDQEIQRHTLPDDSE